MTLDIADLAHSVIDTYWQKLVRTTFNNRYMFDFPSSPYATEGLEDGPEASEPRGLLRVEPPEGGLSDKLFIETSTTHAATDLTEFGAPGAAGADTIMNATPGTISKIIPVGVTGFALDACKGDADKIRMVSQHFTSAFKRLGDAINNTLLGTGVNSIPGALDSTTIYAGLDPAVYTQWAAYENTDGGVLSEAHLEALWMAVTGLDRRANPADLVWGAGTGQIKRFRAMGRMAGVGASVQKVVMADGRPLDLGFGGLAYNERPVLHWPDASTTEFYLLNTSNIWIKEVRSLQITAKPYAGDGELYYLTWRGRLMFPNKFQAGKASGLTA